MSVVKGNEYLGFTTFFGVYEKYKKLGDYADSQGYTIEAECMFCFAAESLLKGILCDNGIRMTRDHDLKLIYDMLPEEYHKFFSDEKFPIALLETHRLNFEKCRYYYDDPSQFSDKKDLTFDASVTFVKKFCDKLNEAHLALMFGHNNFSYDCFDEAGVSHDDNYTFNGELNKTFKVFLKTYPNADYYKGWIKIGYDHSQFNVKEYDDNEKLEKVLEITPLRYGKYEISVSLQSEKNRKLRKMAEKRGDDPIIYKLNNPYGLKINTSKPKDSLFKKFINLFKRK